MGQGTTERLLNSVPLPPRVKGPHRGGDGALSATSPSNMDERSGVGTPAHARQSAPYGASQEEKEEAWSLYSIGTKSR